MGSLRRNRFAEPPRRAQDGDFAMPGEIGGGHEDVVDRRVPIQIERGGGDMTDNGLHGHWVRVRQQDVNHCRSRLMSMSMNILMLVLTPLMVLSLFILLSRIKREILETINKGYVSSDYIQMMNEVLYDALSGKTYSETVMRDIAELNQKYRSLMEHIQQLAMVMTTGEQTIDFHEVR